MGEEVKFFDELPSAIVAYSVAVGALAMAAIAVRIAVHVFTGI